MTCSKINMNERFKSLESKKITKILQNEFKYLKGLLIVSIIFIMATILMLLTISNTDNLIFKALYTSSYIYFTIYFLYTINQLENRKFKKLNSHDRQFYILYLINDNIISHIKNRKYILFYLIIAYIRELHYIQIEHKNQWILSIQEEEYKVDIMLKSFKNKIKGLILGNEKIEEISEIIQLLLNINHYRNIEAFNTFNDTTLKDLNSEQHKLFELLEKLPESNNKIDIWGITNLYMLLNRENREVILVIVSTIFVLLLYLFLAPLYDETISIGVALSLLLMTPTCITVIISIVKKPTNY